MNHPVTVSVVIPCFNHGQYLPEAVASVEAAGRDDVEMIVVDDGSTDERTLQEMGVLASRGIRVIRQENRGLAAARNAGIRAARGELILPLDSDNRIREAYLVEGVKILREAPDVGVVYGNAEYFGERTGIWEVPPFEFSQLAKANSIDACALYRKSVWESVGGYDETMPWMGWEDWDFWLRVAGRGWGFTHTPAITFDYRVRRGSMLEVTNQHVPELLAHIFGKPENRAARDLRALSLEVDQLREKVRFLEESRDYRLGRGILDPIRAVVRLMAQRRTGR
jgi:glycosyltransferase involved in cell wall biosynthesis